MTVARTPYFMVFLLWLAGILAAGQFAKISVTFPLFRTIYAGNGASLGFLVSAVSIVGLFFGLLAGVILARFGVRRLLLAALVTGGVVSLIQSTGLDFGVMIATRVIEGASHLVIVVAAPTMIGQICAPKDRNTAMALWSTVFAVSFALFSWLGSPFVVRTGLPALFIVHGGLMFAVAAVLYVKLPRLPQTGAEKLSLAMVALRYRRAFSSPYISAPALGWVFYASAFVALVTVTPDFLDPAHRQLAAGIMPLSALAVSMTLGVVLLRYVHPVTVLLIGFGCGALFAFAGAGGQYLLILSVAMLGSMGLVQAGSFAAIPALNTTTEDQALANGALAQTGNLGNTLGTPLLLLLTDRFGYAGLVGFGVVLFSMAIIGHLWLAARRRSFG